MTSFCDVIWRSNVTPWCHLIFWHHTVGQGLVSCHLYQSESKIARKLPFAHLVTLTFDLDLWTWARYGPGRRPRKTSWHIKRYIKRFSRESADMQTGPILLPRPLMREVRAPWLQTNKERPWTGNGAHLFAALGKQSSIIDRLICVDHFILLSKQVQR